MNNYEYESIKIEPNNLLKILELAKIVTAEYIVIPRILYQNNFQNCISGITNRTIYSISKYDILNIEQTPIVLWSEPSIHYISFSMRQINPFIKALREELDSIGDITLYYHKYNVNNLNTSIGVLLTAKNSIKIKNSQGTLDWIPAIELNNYNETLFHLRRMIENWNNSKPLFQKSLTDDTEFREIWDRKTEEGAMAWTPAPDNYPDFMRPYILYLSKAMFSVSKKDEVFIELRNEVPNEFYDKFLIKFTVIKKKSKNFQSYHDYYMMGIKMLTA